MGQHYFKGDRKFIPFLTYISSSLSHVVDLPLVLSIPDCEPYSARRVYCFGGPSGTPSGSFSRFLGAGRGESAH